MAQSHIKKIEQELPAGSAAETKKFVSLLFGRTPDEDLALVRPHLLAETAVKHREMSFARKKGEISIDVYTPPLEKDEWSAGHTVINIVMDDMPFLVDSVTALIPRKYKLIHVLIHPILHVRRNKAGKVTKIDSASDKDSAAESHMHIELQGTISPDQMAELKKDLYAVLRDVECATHDWQPMREKLLHCQKALSKAPAQHKDSDVEEYLSFLDYLYNDNFTLLGFREYRFDKRGGKIRSKTVAGSGLGLLRDDMDPAYLDEDERILPEPVQELWLSLPPLTISKVNRLATVHRAVPMDTIAVKHYDEKGEVAGECLFIGLFTSVTYSRSIRDIPLLRHKTDTVMRQSGFKPGSHNYKALRHILEKYPRDELLQIDVKTLYKTVLSILQLQERQRIALYLRPDPFGRYISCLVYVPREKYDTRLRRKFENILEEELSGCCANFHTTLDDSPYARVLYAIDISQSTPPRYQARQIEKKLQQAGRDWSDKLAAALLEMLSDEEEISQLVHKYGGAFPDNYQAKYDLKETIYDMRKIEQALETGRMAMDLYCTSACGEDEMRLKIYHIGGSVILSDVLPLLENMGFKVISEFPFPVRPAGAEEEIWIQDFNMIVTDSDKAKAIKNIKEPFEELFMRAWYGDTENDSLNELVLRAGLGWRDIMMLRAYVHYMRQMRYPFGMRYIEKAMTSHPKIATSLAMLFHALHDPSSGGDRKAKAKKLVAEIEDLLGNVDSLDEDRILRSLVNLVQATLRTNFFQKDSDGTLKNYISLKFDSAAIDALPDPRPYREIFVYSSRVEGVHLRSDVIARGGLRWSDRHEDYRTEILGLLKAQQVKNSVIVPMGAKGGFVVKNPPSEGGRAAMQEEGIACYKLFIRGLLDITDNRKGEKILPPPDVVRGDGDDPYLVVAADKGTASFSDIANKLASEEYDFWLGDAFASGGSAGYDHKAMGITARGTWESVKRHFRELNHDTQSQPFDVVGVGDMGGDVFGNGMLLSRHIRLIGAFNHLHIFCDPDPDTETSYAERERLFKNVKGWDEYDESLLSEGGRIFARTDKALKLTPEICKRFDIDKDSVTPAELITAMLKARTDLLWFGGIGTYIKASDESHADVGDKANDIVRINGRDVRAKVIGEGANLAVTQPGRIEFASRGGYVNADFIDNSGGVDSSDREVNIKILMTDIMAGKAHNMDIKKRNRLLEKMTDEVAALVLRSNYQQTQGLSLVALHAAENLSDHAQLIRLLERRAGLDRALEYLPDDEEIQSRLDSGKGLTRPELGILQAYAKILLSRDLLDSDLPDSPEMQDAWLVDYFPQPLRKPYKREISRHQLRREIIATTLSGSLINRMGPGFIKSQTEKNSAAISEVVRAYIIVRESFGLRPLWDEIEALDNKVPAEVQLRAMHDISQMIDRTAGWFLTRIGRPLQVEKDIKAFGAGVNNLMEVIDHCLTDRQAGQIQSKIDSNIQNGLPKALARQIALIPTLGAACDIIRISLEHKTDIQSTARAYFSLGEHFQIDWLRRQARFITAGDRWTSDARDSLIEQLHQCQAGLTVRILTDMKDKTGQKAGKKVGADIVAAWREAFPAQASQLDPLFTDMRKASTIDLPVLVIAGQRLRHLCDS